jgi:type II secretory ATPase GspE/PulE/Tfp pilus assembly ATPase PilB-like protein
MVILNIMSQDIRRDEERSTERRAQLLHMTYTDVTALTDRPLFKGVLTLDQMRQYRIVPLHVDKNNIRFGITTTTSQQTMNAVIKHFPEQSVAFTLISDSGFRDYMVLYDPPKKIVYENIALNTAGTEELVQRVSDALDKVRADDMLAYLVSQAHKLNASDIHLETQVGYARIRLRIDGVLHPIARLTPDKYRVLTGAVASAANVSTGADEAQQGHIREDITMADGTPVTVNVRLETVPTVNGMDMVMRLFNMDESMYNLDRLGLSKDQREIIDDIIRKPSGLVMAVGPTGSGKTTTLYSILNTLRSDERKIVTIEDPVEYQFPGIVQIPVRSRESGDDGVFAEKLRAILRLDPDVVMVGEIRDNDTAKSALQASLTGHLVLSTFHASSAAAALTRLHALIGQNVLFISAIRLVMAQRLIRRLDDSTKQSYRPSLEELEMINAVIESMPPGTPKPDLQNLTLFKAGSSADNPYGYEGQLAVREQFRLSDQIRVLLQKGGDTLAAEDIEKAAIASGMRTMLQDAMLRVVAGETTLSEVYRVLG